MGSQPPRTVRRNPGDAALAAAVLAIVATMVIPLPPAVLDGLLALNLAASVLVLLVALRAPGTGAVTAFPSVLLVSTLYRLALDVAAARLILARGDAGAVIRATGEALMRGSLVVGAVVFAIITVVQYLVIARGAGRVAEVSARFALDALPGRQLALDADFRAGVLNAETLAVRRAALSRDSRFYGAMDGALRFVRGDAIAGMIVVGVDLVGGVAVGVFQHGMTPVAAVSRYGVLTVGQGLVAQVPALVTATAAGVVVTRVSPDDEPGSLATDVGVQFVLQPQSLATVAALMALMAMVPGPPAAPFLVLAAVMGGLAWRASRQPVATLTDEASQPVGVVPLTVALGTAHAALLAPGSPLGTALDARMLSVGRSVGVTLPGVKATHLAARAGDPTDAVQVVIQGVPEATVRVAPGPAAVDAVAQVVSQGVTGRLGLFVGIAAVRTMLDALAVQHGALVREVVPRPVTVPLLTEVVRGLVSEGLPVRNLAAVLESLATVAALGERDPGVLIEEVRARMQREITHHVAPDGTLSPWLLSPEVEDALRESVRRGVGPRWNDPALAEDIRQAVRAAVGDRTHAVVLTHDDVRRWFWKVVAGMAPTLTVVSYRELDGAVKVTPAGLIQP